MGSHPNGQKSRISQPEKSHHRLRAPPHDRPLEALYRTSHTRATWLRRRLRPSRRASRITNRPEDPFHARRHRHQRNPTAPVKTNFSPSSQPRRIAGRAPLKCPLGRALKLRCPFVMVQELIAVLQVVEASSLLALGLDRSFQIKSRQTKGPTFGCLDGRSCGPAGRLAGSHHSCSN